MPRLDAHAGFVHAIGAVGEEDKWALLADADASVQCSDSESFGLAIVEAMAASVPVVVSRTCPWPEIETRGCGFWADQSAAALADALSRLATDRALARTMGARGASFARERYSWDAVARTFASSYAGLVEQRRHHVA